MIAIYGLPGGTEWIIIGIIFSIVVVIPAGVLITLCIYLTKKNKKS